MKFKLRIIISIVISLSIMLPIMLPRMISHPDKILVAIPFLFTFALPIFIITSLFNIKKKERRVLYFAILVILSTISCYITYFIENKGLIHSLEDWLITATAAAFSLRLLSFYKEKLESNIIDFNSPHSETEANQFK